ncbi:MAG: aldose epimerase family protein [Pseudomonadota bacterium]
MSVMTTHKGPNGADYSPAALRAGDLEIGVLSFGARTMYIRHRGKDLILGYPDPAAYFTDPFYIGAIVGRVANRLANSRITIDGKTYPLTANEGTKQLHGGPGGVSQVVWDMEPLETGKNGVKLTYSSPDGDQGYPHDVRFEVEVALSETGLTYHMRAMPSAPTAINMAQHNYYSLGPLGDARLTVPAARYTPVDGDQIPTGDYADVDGDMFDYRTGAPVHPDIDHNLVLDGAESAIVYENDTHQLTLHCDQPGIQVYSGSGLEPPFAPFQGICLEPQLFPNAFNQEGFDAPLATPEAPYEQILRIDIAAKVR